MKVVVVHSNKDVQVVTAKLSTTEDQGTDIVKYKFKDIDAGTWFDVISDPVQQVEGGGNQGGIDDGAKFVTGTALVLTITTKDTTEQASEACLRHTSDDGSYPKGCTGYKSNQGSLEAKIRGQSSELEGKEIQDEHKDKLEDARDGKANEQLGKAQDGTTGLLDVAGEQASFLLTTKEEDRDEEEDDEGGQEGANEAHGKEVGSQGNQQEPEGQEVQYDDDIGCSGQ